MYAKDLKSFSLLIAMLFSLPLACAEQAMAEPPPATSGDADSAQRQQIRVYKVSYGNPTVITRVIQQVVEPPFESMHVSGHELTLVGTDEQFAAVEAVLKQLDQPPAAPPRPAYITLKYPLPARTELTRLLHFAVSQGTSIAFDPPSRTILVRGTDADIAAVQQLVELIDKPKPVDEPSEVLELTFFFLKSPSAGPAERLSHPVPAFLEPVVQALAENGFRHPSLMTPLIIRSLENDKFTASGALTEAVTEAASDRASQGKIAQVVPELNLPHTTLGSAIGHIRNVGHVNVVVRWNVLEFIGIDRDTEVTVQLKQVALKKALQYILDSAGSVVGRDVGYVFDEGVVVISTREDLREKYGSHQTPLQVSVEGKARILDPGKSAQLDVEAEVYLPPSGGSPMSAGALEARQLLFRVETVLTLPLGEYVVLAAGPVAPDVGQGIAMVVRAEVVGGPTGGKTTLRGGG